MKRSVKHLHPALRDDIGDLMTRRPLPGPTLEHLDPFLFLNHHGPMVYPPHNHGLPFGPHPHRGFETVTFVLDGSLAHRDSGGGESVIHAGGVQWMTAGRGIVHSEVSPEAFLRDGGRIDILQLWVNLPSRLKMTDPWYIGLQKPELPTVELDHGRVSVTLVAGPLDGASGPIPTLHDIHLSIWKWRPGGRTTLTISPDRTIFFYLADGELKVNGQDVKAFHLAEFEKDGAEIDVATETDATLILGHARPFGEPIVSHGPFVMNTREEIIQAIRDYQAGRFTGLG